MHLRRYRKETVMDARRAVREALDPDAFVLSASPVPDRELGGWFGARAVAVIAASDAAPPVSVQRHVPPVVCSASDPVAAIAARLRMAGMD